MARKVAISTFSVLSKWRGKTENFPMTTFRALCRSCRNLGGNEWCQLLFNGFLGFSEMCLIEFLRNFGNFRMTTFRAQFWKKWKLSTLVQCCFGFAKLYGSRFFLGIPGKLSNLAACSPKFHNFPEKKIDSNQFFKKIDCIRFFKNRL